MRVALVQTRTPATQAAAVDHVLPLALEAAESSTKLALEATQLGYRVGVRVNLDVLNAQTQLFQTQRDLAKARYDVIVGSLRLRQLAHAAALLEGSQAGSDALAGSDESMLDRLRTLIARLRPLAQIDTRLSESIDLLETAAIQLDEAASSLSHYADRIDLDPDRLASTDQRIGAIFSAARKFRLSPENIPEALEGFRLRLSVLEAAQDIEQLESSTTAARLQYSKLAEAVSAERKAIAQRFSEGVSKLLKELGMSGARLMVAVEPASPTASGIDAVEFRISPHGSGTARPIAKVASGGELSRIGLAIAVLAAQANPVPTLIFDEADAGVGGAVAEVIGALMRRLGSERQVLSVTHLPQVAACAHQHFKVGLERPEGQATLSRVSRLDRSGRIEEIARMLGGLEITSTTRKHAREMLAQRDN